MSLPSHKHLIRSILFHPDLNRNVKLVSLDSIFIDDHIAHFDNYIPHIEITSNKLVISFAYKLADDLHIILQCNNQLFIDISDLVEYINGLGNIPNNLTDTSIIRSTVESLSGISHIKMYNRRTDNGRRLEFPDITDYSIKYVQAFSQYDNITVSYKNYLTITYTYPHK